MKAKRLLSLILVLALFVQCVPAWAETVTVIQQEAELPFPTEPVELKSLNLPEAMVIVEGERTGDALPSGVTYEDGVLTLDNAHLTGGIWADGDLTVVVRGSNSLTGQLCVENGALRIIGENGGRIEASEFSAHNGSLSLTDVEAVIPVNNFGGEADGVRVAGNFDAVNSKLLLSADVGVFVSYGTLTFENSVFDGMHLWVNETAPIGGIHLTNCEITAHSLGHTLFAYSGYMTLTDTVIHRGHVWAEEGLTAVNTVFESGENQWYVEGEVILKNCEVHSATNGTGNGAGIFANACDLYIEDSVLDITGLDAHVVHPMRAVNMTILNSQLKVTAANSAIRADESLRVENSEITVETMDEANGGLQDANAVEIGVGGVSEIVNSRINAKGNRAGVNVDGGDLNVIASEINSEGGQHGFASGRGDVTVTGGKLNLRGGDNSLHMDCGTLELNGVEANIGGGWQAVYVGNKGVSGDLIAVNGCDVSAEFVQVPNGMDAFAYSANANGDPVQNLTLIPNGELFSVFRASQTDCVMGSNASFVLSYFGASAGDVSVRLPDGMTLVDGSVTVNGQVVSASVSGSEITLPGVLPGQVVRFSVTCGVAGEFDLTAEAAGEVLDSVHVKVKDFSLGLPSATARTTLSVSGVAVPDSEITFYDDGKKIAKTESNLAGDWIAQLKISDTVGEHSISAKIKTPDGSVIEPPAETVTYDPDTIEVLRLVMTNTIHGEQIDDLETCETVFDFTTADVKAPIYSYFPDYPTFTFSAELSANATPEKVGVVSVYTQDYKGNTTKVDLTYNEFTGTWVGTQDYDEFSVPETVQVGYSGGPGMIQLGDEYITYTLDADGGVTLGEGEEAIRIVQSGSTIDITDMDGNGLRLLMVDEQNMILSTTDGETLATVQADEDSMTIKSADESVTMSISETELSLTDVVSGCALFASETGAEMRVPDGGGNITRYLSDETNGERVEYPDGTFEQWQYSEDGLSAAYTARDGSTISYSYDENGNLTAVDGALTIQYAENEIRYSGADGETLVNLDADGRISSIIYPDGLTVGYAYDEAGNLASVTDPMGNSTYYAYDENGGIVSVSDDNGVVAEYAYDDSGAMIARSLANGARTEFVHDEAARTSAIRNFAPDGSVLGEYVTAFDESGLAVSQSGTGGDWTFTYDENGQLLTMTGSDGTNLAYEYTPAGTVSAKTDAGVRTEYTSNALNQITQAGDAAYQYDLNGRMVRETGPDGETVYEWDAFDRLVKLSLPGGDVYEYGYDAFGNRSTVTVNGATTRYIWNPGELPEIIGAIQPDGSYVRYVQGNGLEAQADASGAAYYQYDQLGSTVALTDANGQLLSSWAYNPIGEQVAAQETVTTPFGYVGQYGIMTDGNGLQYMRARYLHENLSTFISPDPAGQLYDVNVYRYAINNRVCYVDLMGEGPVYTIGKWGFKIYDFFDPFNIDGEEWYRDFKDVTQMFFHWLDVKILYDFAKNYAWNIRNLKISMSWGLSKLLPWLGRISSLRIPLAVYLGKFLPWLGRYLPIIARVSLYFYAFWLGWRIGTHLRELIWPDPEDIPIVIFPDEYFMTPTPAPSVTPTPEVAPEPPYYPDDVVPPYDTPPRDTIVVEDPSGYVYEGATMARVEGVTATLYYKPTLETPDKKATVWNAEDYSQINPQITDAEGRYAWMTNNGWFKVVFEKVGYERAESEWLPVPPVQTDVNIAMISLAAPGVAEVYAAGDRIGVSFDKFMILDNVNIELNGAHYDGEIIPVEQENGLVRSFMLWRPDDRDTVNVSISGAVSYAGVEMNPYSAEVQVSNDVRTVEVEQNSIGYGSAETVRIRVLDSWNQPLAGAELSVTNLTDEAVLLLTETAVTDSEGWAEVQLVGLKPAAAVLSVDGRANAQLQVRNEDTSTGVYAEGLARDRQWRIDLHAEWTNKIDESDELVEEYIARFTAASAEIDARVEEEFVTEQLNQWNQEVSELVKSRQNGLFTTEEILRLDEIIAERALYASALIAG